MAKLAETSVKKSEKKARIIVKDSCGKILRATFNEQIKIEVPEVMRGVSVAKYRSPNG